MNQSESQYDWFENRPSRDEAPDECQHNGCEKMPTRWVRYRSPREYVAFCRDCAELERATNEHSKADGKIR
jgi:hypothetical protein